MVVGDIEHAGMWCYSISLQDGATIPNSNMWLPKSVEFVSMVHLCHLRQGTRNNVDAALQFTTIKIEGPANFGVFEDERERTWLVCYISQLLFKN